MFAWNLMRRTRTWKTRLYFVCFGVAIVVTMFDYEGTDPYIPGVTLI